MNSRDNLRSLLIASAMTACGAATDPNANSAAAASASSGGQANPAQGLSVTVTTYKPCQVYLISESEAAKQGQLGWWGAWQQAKQQGRLHNTPYTFTDLAPGTYTVVAYDPASTGYDPNSGNPAQKSDGAVIERFTLGNTSQQIQFNASDFKDWNCLSCPWLFAWNGSEWVRLTEVLTDVVGRDAERTDKVQLPEWAVIHGRVRLRLAEEKDEITFVRDLGLELNGERIAFQPPPRTSAESGYTRMTKGDSLELEFVVPEGVSPRVVHFVATGYYDPDTAMIEQLVRHR